MVELGNPPAFAFLQQEDGWPKRPANARNGGGACVVVRGRESRPHGEGRQWIHLASRRWTYVRHGEYRVHSRHAAQAVSVEYRGPREGVRGSVQFCMRPQNDRPCLAKAGPEHGQQHAWHGRRDAGKVEERPDGVAGFLEEIRQDLRQGTYQPQPVRQRLIPKPGKPGKFRPLGIPTLKDRLVQMALKLVLEPIFEADFYPISYGFRPGRSTHDALARIQQRLHPTSAGPSRTRYVIEGDIKGCFDAIDHHVLMERCGAASRTARSCGSSSPS